MSKLKNILIIVLIVVAVGISTFLAGQAFQRSSERQMREQTITAQTIVNRIQEQAFLVTKTVYIDQQSEIVIDRGSDWSNFWWGQTITAEGLIRTDVGVDLSKLTSENVKVDHEQKTITIQLPAAEILDSSLSGEIEVVTKSGILKKLLLNDANADYNLALSQLTTDAMTAVNADETLFVEARNTTINMLELLLAETGYEVIVQE